MLFRPVVRGSGRSPEKFFAKCCIAESVLRCINCWDGWARPKPRPIERHALCDCGTSVEPIANRLARSIAGVENSRLATGRGAGMVKVEPVSDS